MAWVIEDQVPKYGLGSVAIQHRGSMVMVGFFFYCHITWISPTLYFQSFLVQLPDGHSAPPHKHFKEPLYMSKIPRWSLWVASGQIGAPATTQARVATLQNHHFTCKWQWELTIVGNLSKLIADIQVGDGYAVSDRSFQDGQGAAVWIIKGHMGKNCLIRTCASPSDADSHSSFCSKLAGIYTILFTQSTLLLPTTEKPTVRVACDGKLVILQLQCAHIMDPSKPHANFISAARHLMLHGSMIKTNIIHVKGHQDTHQFGPFTRDATLNIEVDQLAKAKLEAYWPGPTMFHIPWSQGVCYTGNQRIEKNLELKFRTTSMANGWPITGKKGGISLKASGILLTGNLLEEHYRSYQLIIIIWSPNMPQVILPQERTCNNGNLGPRCNARAVWHHKKISTTFLHVQHQPPRYYGINH